MLLVLAFLPLVVGCPTEVPYQPTEDAPAQEVDSSEPATTPEGADETASAEESSDATSSLDPPLASGDRYGAKPDQAAAPSSGDRYASPPGGAPARMPWETDEPAEAAPEAERLFADAGAPAEPTPEAEEPQEEPEQEEAAEDDDGFGDFLGDAYAGLIDNEPAEEPQPTEPKPSDPEPSQPEPSSVAVVTEPDLGSRYDLKEIFPSEAAPEAAISAPPAAEKPTTKIELEDPVDLDDLWAEESASEEPAAPEPTADPEPSPPEETPAAQEATLPFGSTDEPPFFEEETPEPEQPEPVETLPDPPATVPEVATEPDPVLESRPPRAAPLAGSAIDPLPAVPVLPFNTRHLAWLLGAKFGLAELADLDGATPDEVAEWSAEVERLARELRIGTPPSSRQAAEPAERVGRMMRAAARTGEALASEHGVDHAALMEISLKTNALLVVAEKRPDLAAPVARAVRDAADRALLPRFLWDQTVRVLDDDPTPEETLDAVNGLHERVESFLR